jgi:hypothetical protein
MNNKCNQCSKTFLVNKIEEQYCRGCHIITCDDCIVKLNNDNDIIVILFYKIFSYL